MIVALGQWLYANVFGNLVAGFLQIALVALPVWFRKIKPHLAAQRAHRQAEAAHREHVNRKLADLHKAVNPDA